MGASRRRQIAFYLLMVGAIVGAVEVGARLIALVTLSDQNIRDVSEGRRRFIASAAGEAPAYRFESDIQGFENEVLHPYLGFVFDPGANEREGRRKNGMLEITPLGFFRQPGERPSYADASTHVGVFGGSVAMLFSFHARETLIEQLGAARPRLGTVGVRSFALGGYKQPQALMTLNYLLALGERVDIIVNIDGFNELALGWYDNYQHRIFPSYPRAWRQRVEGLPSRAFLQALARRDSLRKTRASIAQGFELPVLRGTATVNLLWLALDRQLAATDSELQTAIDNAAVEGESYSLQGPFETVEDSEELLRSIVEVWKRSSLQMHNLAQANGITYCHFLQPNQYDLGSKPMTSEEQAIALHEESPYRDAIRLGYPMLREAGQSLEEAGVCFVDLSMAFAEIEEPMYTDDCCHFSRAGSRLLAEKVAEVVVQEMVDSK